MVSGGLQGSEVWQSFVMLSVVQEILSVAVVTILRVFVILSVEEVAVVSVLQDT